MEITNEAARFPKTANSIAHCRGTPQLDNSARAEPCRWAVLQRAYQPQDVLVKNQS
jgi:hypothetical protein